MEAAPTLTVRRMVLRLTIGSFSVAAVMGVAALLRPGHFGSTEGRILLTTLIVGAASVLMLCYLAVGDAPRRRWVGIAGGGAALVAMLSLLVMVWGYWQRDPGVGLWRTFGVSGITAVTCAQFSLLLAVVRRPGTVVRVQVATLVTGTVLGAMLIAAVLGWNPGETAARGLGVTAILDVLGTLVTIAVGVFGRDGRSASVTLSPAVAERLRAESARTGRPVGELVDEALGRYFEVPVD
jgi:hypothetical protein